MIEGEVNTRQFNEAMQRLGATAGKIQDLLPGWVADWLRFVIRKSFEGQATAEGAPWQPWSPRYAAHGHGKGMLDKSGALREQTTRAPMIERISADQFTITAGSTLKYAAAHQFGFEGDVSVREFLRVVRTGKDTWGRLLNADLNKRTRQIIARSMRVERSSKHTRHMKIPARPYLPTPEFVEAEGTEIVREAVSDALKAEGIE